MLTVVSWPQGPTHHEAEEEEETTVWKMGPRATRDLKPRAGGWLAQGDTAPARRAGDKSASNTRSCAHATAPEKRREESLDPQDREIQFPLQKSLNCKELPNTSI